MDDFEFIDYDYKVVEVSCIEDACHLEQEIIENSKGGWELASIVPPTEYRNTFFLAYKKPIL